MVRVRLRRPVLPQPPTWEETVTKDRETAAAVSEEEGLE